MSSPLSRPFSLSLSPSLVSGYPATSPGAALWTVPVAPLVFPLGRAALASRPRADAVPLGTGGAPALGPVTAARSGDGAGLLAASAMTVSTGDAGDAEAGDGDTEAGGAGD